MTDDRPHADPELAGFYDLDNRWGHDDGWCLRFAQDARSALDLVCGTGRLAAALADNGRRAVVGVDPAAAMLDLARRRPGGGRVVLTVPGTVNPGCQTQAGSKEGRLS